MSEGALENPPTFVSVSRGPCGIFAFGRGECDKPSRANDTFFSSFYSPPVFPNLQPCHWTRIPDPVNNIFPVNKVRILAEVLIGAFIYLHPTRGKGVLFFYFLSFYHCVSSLSFLFKFIRPALF